MNSPLHTLLALQTQFLALSVSWMSAWAALAARPWVGSVTFNPVIHWTYNQDIDPVTVWDLSRELGFQPGDKNGPMAVRLVARAAQLETSGGEGDADRAQVLRKAVQELRRDSGLS